MTTTEQDRENDTMENLWNFYFAIKFVRSLYIHVLFRPY